MMEKKLNTYENDRTSGNGPTNPMQTEQRKDRNNKSKSQEIIDTDSVGHRTGRDNTYAQQKWQNVETAKEEAKRKDVQIDKTNTIRGKNDIICTRRQLGLQ